jgi:hypothetical protein
MLNRASEKCFSIHSLFGSRFIVVFAEHIGDRLVDHALQRALLPPGERVELLEFVAAHSTTSAQHSANRMTAPDAALTMTMMSRAWRIRCAPRNAW